MERNLLLIRIYSLQFLLIVLTRLMESKGQSLDRPGRSPVTATSLELVHQNE